LFPGESGNTKTTLGTSVRESQSASIQDDNNNNNNNAQKQMEIQNARNHHHMWLRLTEGADTKVILMCLIDGDGDSSSIASFGVNCILSK